MCGGGMIHRAHLLLFLHVSGKKKPRKNLRFIVVQYTHFLIFYIFEMLYARTTPNTDER